MPDRFATRIALPILVFFTAAVLITWPLARHLTTHAAGAGYSDSYELIRHIWWTREALRDGHNPFDQPLLVYPHGVHSDIQWTHPFQYILPALLAFVISPLAAFNLMLLIVLALNGWTAYRLGMYLSGGNAAAALLGGLVFLAFPAMQGHLSAGYIGILWLWPFPLLARCALRLLDDETPHRREIVLGGLWLAVGSLGNSSQIVFTTFPLLLFAGLYLLIAERNRLFRPGTGWRGAAWRDQPWIALILLVAWGGVLLLPFYLPVLIGGGDEIKQISEPGRITYSTDLLAFVSPSPFGVFDRIVPEYTRDVLGTNSIEGTAYLGVIATGLAVIAVLRRRSARLWLAVALGAMLFSLGPLLKWRDQPVTIRIEDQESHIVLPWAAFENLPLIDATRTPGRFNLITGLALSALVSLGAGVVLARVRRREVRIALTVLGGGLILLEYQLFSPFLLVDAAQPDYFRQLAERDDVRAVLDLPVDDNLVAKTGLYLQTLHHKPLIAGHVLRRTTQDPALLAVLDRAATSDDADGWAAIRHEDVPYLLSQAGADRIVVHKVAYADAGAVVDRLHSIFGPPEYEDARYAVFAVPRVTEPPPGFELPGAASVAGWSQTVEAGPFSGEFLADSGSWYFTSATEQYGDLVFRALPYRTPRRITVWLDDHLITGGWIGADDPQSAGWHVEDGTIRLPLRLTPGYHTLRLVAPDGCTDYPFALTCWGTSDLSPDCTPLDPPACISAVFEPPTWEPAEALPTPLDVSLDHGLRLRAYEMQSLPAEQAVRVRLFWDASGPLPRSYALFVHVADPDTGSPLAQFTGYPPVLTSDWKAGTRWQIDVMITLPDDLPAGRYAVNAGWFQPDGGTRLGVHGNRPWAQDGIVHVAMIELGE
jgi:hypothetical protein